MPSVGILCGLPHKFLSFDKTKKSIKENALIDFRGLLVSSAEQIINRNVKIIGDFDECSIIGLAFHIRV